MELPATMDQEDEGAEVSILERMNQVIFQLMVSIFKNWVWEMYDNTLPLFLNSRFFSGNLFFKLLCIQNYSCKKSWIRNKYWFGHLLISWLPCSATLRDNLDPLKSHNDAKLWDALKKARLSEVVKNKLAPHDPFVGGRGLDAMIDHETTFSAGIKMRLRA